MDLKQLELGFGCMRMPLRDFKDEEDLERVFQEQLDHCGVDFFDSYLLHNMGQNVYEKCCKYHVFDFVQRKKKEGKIREAGMSFHDMPELLEEILETYGDALDFVQLQINYLDWEQPNVQSKKCLEIARCYHKPMVVMEPCKGGMLAKVPEEVEKLFRDYDPEAFAASWAMRFAASQEGVFRVLSGMNDESQLEDNMKTFREFKPLTEEEYDIIWKAASVSDAVSVKKPVRSTFRSGNI